MISISIRAGVEAGCRGEAAFHLVRLHQRQRRAARTDAQGRFAGLRIVPSDLQMLGRARKRNAGATASCHNTPMVILGIETTCDETAAAVVERTEDGHGRILSNVVLSQITEHAAFGGVVPEIAARAHVEALDSIIAAAMREAQVSFAALDGVAAAAGPGPDRRRHRRPDHGEGHRAGAPTSR